jgi:hypothetical protein
VPARARGGERTTAGSLGAGLARPDEEIDMAQDWNRGEDRDDDRRREGDRGEGRYQERYGGRGYEQVGQEQQGGWRGPGEMPGYRDAGRRGPQPFLQPSSGGQVPGEMRDWERDRGRQRDHDPRDRDRDPRTGRLGPLEGRTAPRTGPHAGRGPRNYRRPDARIHEDLCERITADPWLDARDVEVEVSEARVILRGAVPDRAMKHRAEDLADGVFGVADVDNQIRVLRPGGARGGAGDDPTRSGERGEGRTASDPGEPSEDRH